MSNQLADSFKSPANKMVLGTMTFGRQNTVAEAHDQLNFALDHGITYWDTAEMYPVPAQEATYGDTERIIGKWFQETNRREDVFLATKLAGPNRSMTYIREDLNFSAASIRQGIDNSLQRLQTDYIDLYQLHWPERQSNMFGQRGFTGYDDPWEENFHAVLTCLSDCVNEGKIRYIGVSNETPWGVMRFVEANKWQSLPKIVTLQNPYSLLNRTAEIGLAEVCFREKIDFWAYSPMAFGVLSNKYELGMAKPTDRLHAFPQMARYNSPEARLASAKYAQLAQKMGITPAQLALAFVMQQPFVSAAIIGATSLEQLKENIAAAAVELTPELLKEVEVIHRLHPDPSP